jgi:hypothetical protein
MVCKEAGRPWPVICEDDVIDFQIMEAVAVKAAKDKEKAQKAAQKKQWQKDKAPLETLR